MAELQQKFFELGGKDESVKAAMSTLLARVASLKTALNERSAPTAAPRQDPWWNGPRGASQEPWSGGAGAAIRSALQRAATLDEFLPASAPVVPPGFP